MGVECKHWKEPVSKLHVLALRAIVTDVGADKGILLSEAGFQSGAIEASNLTNVQVATLADLRRTASDRIGAVRLGEPPYELWKFGKPSGSKTAVDFFAVLTEEWLKEKWLLVEKQQQKVIACSNNRGYAAF
jgi:hypothetical protein